jgi:pyruvate dehydrogenase E2 component (dihydrolipoamide acetyltransferase)
MFEFKMPQLGETVLEATITKWLKGPGEAVEVDEPLVEVSTDKVDSEIPSPAAGTLSRVLANEGDTVLVGAVMAEIDPSGSGVVHQDGRPAAQPAPKQHEAPEPKAESRPPAKPAPPTAPKVLKPVASSPPSTEYPAPAPQVSMPLTATDDEPGRGVLSPLVRRLAAENQVDLTAVRGTGKGGRITRQDVMEAAASDGGVVEAPEEDIPAPAAAPAAVRAPAAAPPAPAPAPTPAVAGAGEEIVQVSPMRRAIAEHMVASMRENARAWNSIEVDMSRVGKLRALAGPSFKAKEGFSLTWMPFVCKAITQGLIRYPQLNATWNGDGTITRKHYVNLGIAVALENGLIVPVVKGAENMNIQGLARGVWDVADRARNRKLSPDDVQGGTFTLTNPGTFGSILSVPIINRGQTAILSFDAVVKRPVVVTDDQGADVIAIRQMTYLSIAWDHRIIDGAEAARFLAYVKGLLEAAEFTSDLSGHLSE